MKRNNKRSGVWYVILECTVVVGFVIVCCIVDFENFIKGITFLQRFNKNLEFFIQVFKKIWPYILLVAIIHSIVILKRNIRLEFTKLSIAGLEFQNKKPADKVCAHLRNYLNTKRSIFYFVESEDNIAHLIHSYHAIYDYMRDALQKYDYIVIDDKEDYHIIKKYLMILNRFLTKHQNNYERWYYKVKDDNAAYEMDIMMLQKQYRHYDELVADICSLNKQMNEFADYLGVDLKWYQELFSVNVE